MQSELSNQYEALSIECATTARRLVGGQSDSSDQTYAQLSTTYALLALLHKDDEV